MHVFLGITLWINSASDVYLFFKKNQQFITLSIRADHSSYSINTYMEPEPTGEKREMK